jgi:nucleoside-diphosphate-sugar epimerase
MDGVHVVFGTGAIGLALVDELRAAHLPVRAVNRSGRAAVPDGVDVVGGDAADPTFAQQATAEAAAVYQCLGPPYHRWAELFPALQDSLVAATRSAGARYVSFENVYLYGDTHGAPLTEATPQRPHTHKGKVRAAMAERLRRLHDAGDLAVTTARASDYFGPRATTQSPLGDRVVGAALAGKAAQVIGDPDQPHSYTYAPDAGVTLAALGTRDDVLGQVWHVPNAPARTTREVIGMIADEIGAPVKVRAAPAVVLRVMGLVNPTVRELPEMLYEFTQPFIVDGSKAEERLGITATPLDRAVRDTVAWFRNRRSAGRAGPS